MIPYKLRLENFLSYREGLEPLDFAGMHLVCLVGENGHGKSALLDAVTWALWGKARSHADDDLMHVGSAEMQVEFEFGLAGQRYNVVRKRLASGKTRKSELELAVWDAPNGAWQPLTEPTMKVTQARIDAILRMDYDTFRHSAFLKQGEADAFSRALPGERKDILGKILNLAQYDAYAERAKVLMKETQSKVAFLEGELKSIEEELGRQPQYEEDLRRATTVEMQARLAKVEAEQEETTLKLKEQALAGRQSEKQDVARRLQRDVQAHAETARQLQNLQARRQEVEVLLAERQVVESDYAALQAARQEEARWNERALARRPLESEQQRLQRELLEAKGRIETERQLTQKEWENANKRARSLPELEPKAGQLASEIARLEAIQESSQAKRERAAKMAAERERLEQEKKRVQNDADALKERLKFLQAGGASECPVCKQPLGSDGRQHLEQEYAQQIEALRQQFKGCQDQQKQLVAAEQDLKAALAAEARETQSLKSLQNQSGQLEQVLNDARAAVAELPALQARVDETTTRLDRGDFAHATRARLAEIEGKLAVLVYDEMAHKQASATVSDLQTVERRYFDLDKAMKEAPELLAQVGQLQARWQHEEENLAADRSRLQQIEAELAVLPDIQARLRQQQQAADQARRLWEDALSRMAGAKQKLQTCEVLRATRAERQETLTQVKEQVARYHQLQAAFGPSGVQAMIIEAALPELETEANLLLGRLSDGRMNVRLQTQKELKSGGVRETLDIIIADEIGQRAYEMYSGGEAFRADLALRIALSRLLARRAGAALQTLFIDEGFGTQDAHGRENLVEAIHMIKDEFALVLVITHIDELKEQFPVRIQVVKEDGRGSRYAVL